MLSDDQILRRMRDTVDHPATARELLQALGISRDARAAFKRRLRALVASGSLVEMHERAVFRTALAALGDAGEADDTAQEAFVIAWQRLSGFRHEASFRTWLLTITWRKALDRRRRQRRWWSRAASPDAGAGTAPVDRLESASADPERQAVAGDLLRKARAEIVRLSPKLRDTLLLASSGEHSYEQIATLQGIPLGTVKWRVAEARRQLTRRLGDRPGGPR